MASDSTSAGSSGAIALTNCARSSVRDALNTLARLTRSWARKSTWSPARDANAANSSAASIDQSSRGQPPGIGSGGVDADTARRRAAGVQDDDHPTVAFGPPRAHHDVGAASGGAPVDGPDVVADDIFAQRVELGALAADQHRNHAVQLPQLGQSRRQMLTGKKRRQDADLPWHPMRALPTGKTERTDRAGGDQCRLLIAPAHRPQPGIHLNLLSRCNVQRMGAWLGAPTRRPRVADLAAEPPSAGVLDRQARRRRAGPAVRRCPRTG